MNRPTFPRRHNYTELCGEQEFFATPLLEKSIEMALRFALKDIKAARVLDVGAGGCPLRDKLLGLGCTYKSLDIEHNESGTIDYVARIDTGLPDSLASCQPFDLIVCTEVLEHVPDWAMAFDNLARLLKPGGWCIITTPFFYMLHEEPHDFWRPTDHALKHFAQSRHFEIVHSQRNGDGWDVLGTLICSMSVCRKSKTLLNYVWLAPALILHRLLKAILKSRLFQSSLDLQMRFYVGNLFILRSPVKGSGLAQQSPNAALK